MLSYVNIHGRPVSVAPPIEVKKKARAQPDAYHKGWRVMGIPPGSLEKAQQEHIKKARDAEKRGKPIADFDQGAWLAKAKKKAGALQALRSHDGGHAVQRPGRARRMAGTGTGRGHERSCR
jgi:hypothetical protein